MSYPHSRPLGRPWVAVAAGLILLTSCRAGSAPTGSGGSAEPLAAATETPSPTATTSPSATGSPTGLPSESASPTASPPPTRGGTTSKPVKTAVPTPTAPPYWDPDVGYSVTFSPALAGGSAKLTLHLGVPATCRFKVTYHNLGTTSLGTATAVWNGKWGPGIGYDVARAWTVPRTATGTATVAWSCSYLGTVKASNLPWSVSPPATPSPIPWTIFGAMSPTYPGGTGQLISASIGNAACTLKVCYLDGTTTSINFAGTDYGFAVTWIVPTSVPTGDTPYLITCTYQGVTRTASGTFAINPPPSPSP